MPEFRKNLDPIFLERLIEERHNFYVEQLKSIEQLINERDRQYELRFKASETAVSAALSAQEKAVTTAFSATEKAVNKAEQAQKEYNERSNEFRGQLDDQAKTLMPRPENLSMFKAVEEKIAALHSSLDGRITNVQLYAKSELDSTRNVFEKNISAVEASIVSLRESRSEGSGEKSARFAMGQQNNWAIGLAIVIAMALIQMAFKFIGGQNTSPQVIYAPAPAVAQPSVTK